MITVTDITGRIVRTMSVEKPVQGQTVQMSVNELSAGTYMVNIKTDTRQLVQKLMLTK